MWFLAGEGKVGVGAFGCQERSGGQLPPQLTLTFRKIEIYHKLILRVDT
jgi:hypothetical protein